MKVTFIKGYCGPETQSQPIKVGDNLILETDTAKMLIKNGYAKLYQEVKKAAPEQVNDDVVFPKKVKLPKGKKKK